MSTMGLGPVLPYANQEVRDGRVFEVCPVCGVQIECIEQKDFESFTHAEYAAHYLAEHQPDHDCWSNAVPYVSDGALGHGWECGICGAFLQAG